MLRQINLAHFALAFLGAYLTYQLAGAGMDPLATLAVIVPFFFRARRAHALAARALLGERLQFAACHLRAHAIIEALIQWIWTADFRRMESAYGEVKFRVGALYVALPELLTLAMAVALSLLTWAWLRHTYTGKAMRAIARMRPSPPPSASTCAGSRSCSLASPQPLPALQACASRSATRWRRDRFMPGWGGVRRGDARRSGQSA